ncbi:hypothetical protein C2R22_06755 [Salinigranum rubrum]|uniref:Uncharacterized protein n=1 Tax=Salinigranum rubrum TaxID=755307 RepID=A0A2I8VHH8_9EURY|nr:hypothetical protein [Salinigranum rubrum]AUV81393.1 hypothetical protein C2R22_06755 [Salinigranum rubrum]
MSSRYATTDSPSLGIVTVALVAYSLVVCALHFGGLAHEVYTAIWWWDILTHSLSGFGVAAWLALVRFVPLDARQVVVLPLVVVAIGAGFEVYEYLFKDFYVEWTLAYYATDTVIDLVVDGLGAAAFAVWARTRLTDEDHDASLPTE